MKHKKWIKKNQWFIDAIANEEKVRFWNDDPDNTSDSVPWSISVCGQCGGTLYRSRSGLFFKHASPIPKTERRYRDPVEIMQWLVNHGYRADDEGAWVKEYDIYIFLPNMWKHCGNREGDNRYKWHPEWIKEVEV